MSHEQPIFPPVGIEDRKEEDDEEERRSSRFKDTDMTPRTVSIEMLRKWYEQNPFDRKDEILLRSWQIFQDKIVHNGGRVRAVDLAHLSSLYERKGDFFQALTFLVYIIEEFPKYEKLAEVAFRCASLLVQLQFDQSQIQIQRAGYETKLLIQALHYLSKISVHRPFGLSESEMF